MHQTNVSVKWRSPSNIAIVKYWGKHGLQLPNNPSISFTLSNAHTTTEVVANIDSVNKFSFDFLFEGKKEPAFIPKLDQFFKRVSPHFTFLNAVHLSISSSNSFPHSSGIASSASAISALALCLRSIEQQLSKGDSNTPKFWQKASEIARLGSGSACRSVFGNVAMWGKSNYFDAASNKFAAPIEQIHQNFTNYKDYILIVSSNKKSVSSTAGHQLMNNHPKANERYATANTNIKHLLSILKTGDLNQFCKLCESEADELHELMRTSNPPYNLLKPNTLKIIELIKAYRAKTNIPVCYTLDAGPNVHVLFPESEKSKVADFIHTQLKPFCENGLIIEDEMGKGPQLL